MAKEYFSLIGNEANDIVFGNVQLAEDRIPSTLLVFNKGQEVDPTNIIQDDSSSVDSSDIDSGTTNVSSAENSASDYLYSPRTGFVHDANYYYEAEKPLSQLVKQRRRWLNGTLAAYLWVIREGWIWDSKQSIPVKLIAFIFVAMNLIQGLFIRIAAPAILNVLTFKSILACESIFFMDEEELVDFISIEGYLDTDLWSTTRLVATGVTFFLVVFHAIFMFAHTPRAVPIKDASGKATEKWRYDRKSAFRPFLFALSLVISALQMALILGVVIATFVRLGWDKTPNVIRAFAFLGPLPYAVALLDGLLNSKRPNLASFSRIVEATPAYMIMSVWFSVWLPAYAGARVSDLSWGNRENSSDKASQAKILRRTKTGKNITLSLVCGNILLTAIFVAVIHTFDVALKALLFLVTGLMLLLYFIWLVDLSYRIIKRVCKALLCADSCSTNGQQEKEVNGCSKKVFGYDLP